MATRKTDDVISEDDRVVGRQEQVLVACYTLFTACFIISSVTATKLWSIHLFGQEVAIPVGTSLFAITFLSTDLVSEVWGKQYSYYLVAFGACAKILAMVFFLFAVWIEPAGFWTGQESFETVLSGSSLVIFAGIASYMVSQFNDVYIFHYLKSRDAGKNLLWKRNVASTVTSQFLDSFVFVVIAFAWSMSLDLLIATIIGQILIKWAIAIVDTPFVYMLRNYAQGRPTFDFSG